jgi:transposase
VVVARDQLIMERTRIANRLHAHLVVIAPGYRALVRGELTEQRAIAAAVRLVGRSTGVRSDLAKRELRRLRQLTAEIAALHVQIRSLVEASGSSLPRIPGVAAITAAKLLGETGDPRRIRSRAAFAAMSGTAPVPASSGQTVRHRLNRGGNRQLNRALHTIAVVQARMDPRAKAYMAKRMAEGKSRLEALRCLKRHLANVVLPTMLADANALAGTSGNP